MWWILILGIWGILLLFYVIKMVITEAKEEADDIEREMRNKKNEDGIWVKEPYYSINDTIPYGHGEKSVMMISTFINLSMEEMYAIRWHMGFSEPKELHNTLSLVFEKYPLVMALHEADLEATYILENRGLK